MLCQPGDAALGAGYASGSQRARVITEAWIRANGYCLACESDRLEPTTANTQARDFECFDCGHAYELKSGRSVMRGRVVDGAYESMMRRITTSTVSSFLMMRYSSTWHVQNLFAIHSALITPAVIQQRKPLSEFARRAGWVGCNILLDEIPPEGRIPLVVDGIARPKPESRRLFAAVRPLSHLTPAGRGWASSVLAGLHKMGTASFTTEQAYGLEQKLALEYPKNKHVRAKIRQQLQVLRDAGLLTFEYRGVYRFSNEHHP